MDKKYVYPFGPGLQAAEGIPNRDKMKELLGGKGGNVASMSNMGLPVPPGFTISTEVCAYFYAHAKEYPSELMSQVASARNQLQEMTGRTFGDRQNPLLVSVRSGARASMPGMMDTILNLGLNDATTQTLAELTNDWRFACDCYRRLIEMYGSVVHGIDKRLFDKIIDEVKLSKAITLDTQLSADDWMDVLIQFKGLFLKETGQAFPQDPHKQLWGAISAVFGSWMNPRAITYRRLENIPESWGTAVTVQAMVFGNMGTDCATGVAFTRNPSTGEKELYGEFLVNAQGEDVVAGIRTPQSITEAARIVQKSHEPSMEMIMPEVFNKLEAIMLRLEKHFRDMQDIEFTIERGKLWMLQTRDGKRTARAAVKIAVDLANEGLITQEEAICRIKDPSLIDQLLHPIIDPQYTKKHWLTGLPASPGAVCGEICFSAEDAVEKTADGRHVILVREETCPDDIEGMHAAVGILTARGGMTSHAAVVARGMGKPCVAGAQGLHVDYDKHQITINGTDVLGEGDRITIDGATGAVYLGTVPTCQPTLPDEYRTFMTWVDETRRMKVRTNAETPEDARRARELGCEGIGLARTEHMFFGENRIPVVIEMIMAENETERRAALGKLLPMQRNDFVELFKIMDGLPVTIRLLDPPLHEFLPKTYGDFERLAVQIGKTPEALWQRANSLRETNPMLGLRGVRLSIVFPEIVEMQARAIFEAAVEANFSTNASTSALLEIMIPLVNFEKEFVIISDLIENTARIVLQKEGVPIVLYKIGTMIELPRACVMAGKLAQSAEFFSFGTNDLTQTALGISRDDAGTFLGRYVEEGIIPIDPFISIDEEGVGEFMKAGVQRARAVDPNMKLGVCGEHGGDPRSIRFFEKIGLDYVSCSPFRVPIARLAAAQATIRARKDES